MRKDQGIYFSPTPYLRDEGVLYLNGDSNAFASVEFFNCKEVDAFYDYVEAANDALDFIVGLVSYKETMNTNTGSDYHSLVDILIRAGRR